MTLSSLGGNLGAAISDQRARQAENRRNWPKNAPPLQDPGPPIPELQDKARVTAATGYRFVLPDGRPLETSPLTLPFDLHFTVTIDRIKPDTFPVDPSKLVDGSAVLIRSDDPRAASETCAKLKAAGVHQIWMDSRSDAAIQAAISSGLLVDLVVRPWAVQHGESCGDPDRTLVGQTGSQLDQLPELARFDPITGATARFGDSFSPADSGVSDHFSRLVHSIPSKGIHAIVLFDTQLEGYQPPSRAGSPMHFRGVAFVNGKQAESGLAELEPAFFEFGYSTSLRLAFLRKYQMDPVDLGDPQFITEFTLSIPYFRRRPFPGGPFDTGPKVQFPDAKPDVGFSIRDWEEFRNSRQASKLDELLAMLYKESRPLYVQPGNMSGFPSDRWSVSLYDPKTAGDDPAKQSWLTVIQMTPARSEDGHGNVTATPPLYLKGPICFDLREVPTGSLDAYLHYMFKPAP